MKPDALLAQRPAILSLELASVARGIGALDHMIKRAENVVVAARSFSPGRYLILLSGSVAEAEEALAAGLEHAAEHKVDETLIRDPHPRVRDALRAGLAARRGESLLIVETSTISSALYAADRALKESDVDAIELRLGAGLSGKGVFTLSGALHMVEAARDAVEAASGARLMHVELIAQPHADLPADLLGAELSLPRR